MTNTLGRFKIISGYPPALPRKCAVCGTSESADYFDFGLDLDFYGTVYICIKNCFREAANCIDYYSPAQHSLALERVEQLREVNNKLHDENEELRSALGALNRVSPTTNISPRSIELVESESETKPATEFGIDKRVEESEPEPVRQVNESGPTNVQRDDNLDEFLSELDI